MNSKRNPRRFIRCLCGGIARAMFPSKPPHRAVEGLYNCRECGDIIQAATGKVVGGGLSEKELRKLC